MPDDRGRSDEPSLFRYYGIPLGILALWFAKDWLPWQPPLIVGILMTTAFVMAMFIASSLRLVASEKARKVRQDRPPADS